jgi:hypothetical protein
MGYGPSHASAADVFEVQVEPRRLARAASILTFPAALVAGSDEPWYPCRVVVRRRADGKDVVAVNCDLLSEASLQSGVLIEQLHTQDLVAFCESLRLDASDFV